jgi:N-carbamoylputrescine amidase
MIEKHLAFIEDAAKQGVQMLCLQELFYGPYFCAEQKTHWYGLTEAIPDGPTTQLMMETAKRLSMVIVVPIYEMDGTGIYYNTASVIDAGGAYLGKYENTIFRTAIPDFGRSFTSGPATLAIRFSRPPSAMSAFTFVTTDISRKAPAASDSMARRLSSILRRPSRV